VDALRAEAAYERELAADARQVLRLKITDLQDELREHRKLQGTL